MQSDQLGEGHWEERILTSLTATSGAVQRLDDTTLAITIPRSVMYDTHAPEEVSVSVPGELLASRQRTVAEPSVVIYASPGRASLSGTLMAHNSELALRSPASYTLDVTLVGDKWVRELNLPAGAPIVRKLLQGLRAAPAYEGGMRRASAEPHGWDAEVAPMLSEASVIRFDDQRLRVVIPQVAAFDIIEPSTIGLVVPAEALLSNVPIESGNTALIRASAGLVHASGSLLNATEASIVQGATLDLSLTADEWREEVGTPRR